MKVSTRGDYASRALLSLALHSNGGQPTSVRDIAERTALPQPYLEQILLALKGAGLVRSKRGVGGGYVLAHSPSEITLGDIVAAVDGPIAVGDFAEPHTDGACNHEGRCALLEVWHEAGSVMVKHLNSYSLADMAARARGLAPAPDGATPLIGVGVGADGAGGADADEDSRTRARTSRGRVAAQWRDRQGPAADQPEYSL